MHYSECPQLFLTYLYYNIVLLFTTSWDDGYELDMQIADLLDDYGTKGTFYICPVRQQAQKMLEKNDIVALAKRHEVGAHTVSHLPLTDLSMEEVEREVHDSKQWVESVSGQSCSMFCYPFGACSEQIASIVARHGFLGARTTEQHEFAAQENPHLFPTTLRIYPFPFRPVFNRRVFDPIREHSACIRECGLSPLSYCSWLSFAKRLFTYAYEKQKPWFHIWGHSAEIEKYGLWKQLRSFLHFVSTHEGIEHCTNRELVSRGV